MSDQLHLRPVAEEDLALVERLTGDPEAAGEHGWHGWYDLRPFRRRWAETGLLTDDGGMLMAVRPDEPLGFVQWRRQSTNQISHCWQIGIAMVPKVRGLGYGTEAQRLLVDYLFAHTQVNRVEAITEITNTAEQWALSKAGFTREGVLRGYGFRDGAWRDSVIYSILRDDLGKERGDVTALRPSRHGTGGPRRDDQG